MGSSVHFFDADRPHLPVRRRFTQETPLPLVVHLRSAVTVLGRYPALAGVDLDVAPGEVVLLSGPNGAGKTTLLRLLAGLAPLTSGVGTVLGHDLGASRGEARREMRRHLALLGHETFCYDDLSATENLRFQARAAGRSAADADAVVERVGLASRRRVAYRLLSAGQRRRLALGVVLVRNAPLLLLDEPHAGLDAGGRGILSRLIQEAAGEGRTVILSSHELELARPLADREVVIVGGQAQGRTFHAAHAPVLDGESAPRGPDSPSRTRAGVAP